MTIFLKTFPILMLLAVSVASYVFMKAGEKLPHIEKLQGHDQKVVKCASLAMQLLGLAGFLFVFLCCIFRIL